jgi:hypothetical protein
MRRVNCKNDSEKERRLSSKTCVVHDDLGVTGVSGR